MKRKLINHSNSQQATHAGGIVFRTSSGSVEYLLVGPHKEVAGEWLLAKGHIDEGEEALEAAVREVREETGFTGRVLGLVGSDEFEWKNMKVITDYYLIEALAEVEPEESRRLGWFSFAKALETITHSANRTLLEDAERIRQHYPGEGIS